MWDLLLTIAHRKTADQVVQYNKASNGAAANVDGTTVAGGTVAQISLADAVRPPPLFLVRVRVATDVEFSRPLYRRLPRKTPRRLLPLLPLPPKHPRRPRPPPKRPRRPRPPTPLPRLPRPRPLPPPPTLPSPSLRFRVPRRSL